MNTQNIEIFDVVDAINSLVNKISEQDSSNKKIPSIEKFLLQDCYKEFAENIHEIKNQAPITSKEIHSYLLGISHTLNIKTQAIDTTECIVLMNNLCTELKINDAVDNYTSISQFQIALSSSEMRAEFRNTKTENDLRLLQKIIASYRPASQQDKISALSLEIDSAIQTINNSNSMVDALNREAKELDQRLRAIGADTGFVELNDGFQSLREIKVKELKSKTTPRRWITFFIFLAIFAELCVVVTLNSKENALEHSLIALPIFTALLLLIYFFRLVYREEDAVRSQILQIDLRMSLIKFLKSYSDHANEFRPSEKRGTELEKFESIVFSNIAPTQEKMPGAFDGVDEVIKLLKASK